MTSLPLALGGNVFGWTADEPTSFAVLDAFVAAGGTRIDTSDSYMANAPGNSGGESETIIGRWLASRGQRDRVEIATKVAKWAQTPGLSPANLRKAIEGSLRRLQTDHVDLYYAHQDDPEVPQEDYLAAFDELVQAGKVRAVGLSNFTPDRIRSALTVAGSNGLTRPSVVQDHYNLLERKEYEEGVGVVVAEAGLTEYPYFGLARGYLTGKYRPGTTVDSPRAGGASAYDDERGRRVLAVLDEVGAAHGVAVATVALAWLASRPGVGAPLASARTPEQLEALVAVGDLTLTTDELERITSSSD